MINQSFALDPNKVNKYGKTFGTIDFDPRSGISREVLKLNRNDTVVGDFHIGGGVYNVTLAELDRIIETAISAKESFQRRYILGL